MLRRVAGSALPCCAIIAVLIALFPISNRMTRIIEIGAFSLTFLALLILAWPKKALRICILIPLLAGFLFLLLPTTQSLPFTELKHSYLSHLKRYESVNYVWGGENFLGMDCSGLVRRAMVDALLDTGFRAFNPRLVRDGIRLWWTDATAQGLGDGTDTEPIQTTPAPLPTLTHLQPGDLIVSADGIHVLAYLGDDKWIDADPSAGKVRILPTSENPWLVEPVRIVRWKWLAEPTE